VNSDTFALYSLNQAHNVITTLWLGKIRPAIQAGQRMVVTVRPATRSSEQNAKFHALLGDISKQVEWAGARREPETWKRLIVAAWLRARGEHVEVLPALDGRGVDVVFERTSKLSVPLMSELIEFTLAWAAQNGVETGDA
jgi:hypothetical protein